MVTMKDTNWNDMVMKLGSFFTAMLLARAYIPRPWQDAVNSFLAHYTDRITRYFSPYTEVVFEEYTGDRFHRNKVFDIIDMYLSECTSMKAKRLKASFIKDGKALVLRLGDNQEVTDEFRGVKIWWRARKYQSKSQTISFYPGSDEKRYYRLTFHSRNRQLITESYLNHVLQEGKAIAVRRRQRKLFTNIKSDSNPHSSRSTLWSSVEFKHPATFDTLAMEPSKKQGIIDDLIRFTDAKDYYKKIGKPWKRGYLLFGPPGTGKSTMISAMANLLEYDVYDLELTAVSDNTQLRRLLIDTSNKSIIVIEDIDCSLDLTGQRSEEKQKEEEKEKDLVKKKLKDEQGSKSKKSEVTLSGLLNFIDGLWSACGDERLIIFTTNYVEKLDAALIRTGRMDLHIELSYCCFESFKVLARNYLDVENHPLFETVRRLLEETKMTPADVAESLMPKSLMVNVEGCLGNLVKALQKVKKEDGEKKRSEVKEEERNGVVEKSTVLEEDDREVESKDETEDK